MTDDEGLARPSALYDQVAGRIRDDIARGTHQPGDLLPSEAQLSRHYGVSRQTIRQAITTLRAEGLVDVQHGRGTFVRTPPVQLTLSRYGRAARTPGAGPFEATCAQLGIPGYGEVVIVETRTADDLMAARLEIEPGDKYVYRRRYMHAGDPDRIIQIQEGHLPHSLVKGTPLAGTAKLVDGTYAALDAIGHGPASITEEVSARMPTREESAILVPNTGVPVLRVVRTTRDSGGRVVEWLVTTALADQNVFLYEDLPVA